MKIIYKLSCNYLTLFAFFITIIMSLTYTEFAVSKEASLLTLDGGLIQEKDSGKMWQGDHSKKLQSLAEVQEYLNSLNQGNYKDWRLPTKQESLKFVGFFDQKKNGEVKVNFSGDYWLIDDDGIIRTGSWETTPQCGIERTFYKGKTGHVRAVRP